MAKVSLYLDQRRNCGEEAPLKVRISSGSITKFVRTKLKLSPEDWEPSSNMVRVWNERTLGLSADLMKVRSAIDDVLESLPRSLSDNTVIVNFLKANIESKLTQMYAAMESSIMDAAKVDTSKLFMSRMRAYRDSKQISGTYEVYDRTIKAITAFDPDVESKTFEQIDYDWLKRFEAHCLKTMMTNSLSILMRNIRTVFNAALDDEITEAYPFRKYKIKQQATSKRSLSMEEFRDIMSMDVESWHEEYRDMFLLSFLLIGINMTDLLSLRPEDLRNGRIEYQRAKTGSFYSVKVEPEAMALISRHRGDKYLLAPLERYRCAKDYIQKMDRALKQLGRKTGKKGKILSGGKYPKLSSYWARHSWATFAYNLGISIDDIAQALGHKDRQHAVTMVYIRQDTRRNDENNRRVIDYVSGKISEKSVI